MGGVGPPDLMGAKVSTDPAAAKAAAGKWFVLPDTSIALQTYESPKPNLLDNLSELGKHGNRIITTFALRDEFLRNRNYVMSKLAPVLEPKTPSVPHFALKWPEGSAYLDARDKSDDATKALIAKWQTAIENPDQDEVWKAVHAILDRKGDLALTREHPEYRKHFEAAQERLALGNPPQKNRGDALGDPLNWEWSLTVCEKNKANLVVLTADGDYSDGKHRDDWITNAFLLDEFHRRVGFDRQLIVTSRTTFALEKIGQPVTEEQKKEETEAIVEVLQNSIDARRDRPFRWADYLLDPSDTSLMSLLTPEPHEATGRTLAEVLAPDSEARRRRLEKMLSRMRAVPSKDAGKK